jgi:hypothetical protein
LIGKGRTNYTRLENFIDMYLEYLIITLTESVAGSVRLST